MENLSGTVSIFRGLHGLYHISPTATRGGGEMAKNSTYIDRMEHFILNEYDSMAPSERTLYLKLFHLNNAAFWAEWFEARNTTLMALTGLTENNLVRAKNGLKKRGLIDFTPGRRGKPSQYKLFSPKELTLSKYPVKIERVNSSFPVQIERETERETERESTSPALTGQGLPDPSRHKTKDIRHIYAQKPPKKGGVSDLFFTFWKAYPKKKAKKQAEKAFLKLKPDEALLDKMLKALERQKASQDWQKQEGQFIPYPATWLNGARWEDEEEAAAPPPPSHTLTMEEQEARRRKQEAEELAYIKRMEAKGNG